MKESCHADFLQKLVALAAAVSIHIDALFLIPFEKMKRPQIPTIIVSKVTQKLIIINGVNFYAGKLCRKT
mgnify:CR=1 FL=1